MKHEFKLQNLQNNVDNTTIAVNTKQQVMKEFTPLGYVSWSSFQCLGLYHYAHKNSDYIKLQCSNGFNNNSNGFKAIKNPYLASFYSQKDQKLRKLCLFPPFSQALQLTIL